MGKSKTLAQQIAELDDPVPKDIDPEEDRPAHRSDEDSGSGDSDDGLAGTEHYVDVGKSKLRKKEEVALGPQYAGSRISRDALNDDDEDEEELDSEQEDAAEEEGEGRFANPDDIDFEIDENDGDIDSDEAFEESDEEKFKGFIFGGSNHPNMVDGRKTRATATDFMLGSEEEEEDGNMQGSEEPETDEDILDVAQQHAENSDGLGSEEEEEEEGFEDQSDESDAKSSKTSEDDNEDTEKSRRAEIRKMMSEEQQTVVATISQAAKADADKGSAVKAQRKAFDSLLNVRIRLQKALVSTNSLSTIPEEESSDSTTEPYVAAEEAAIKLWNTLDSLRSSLSQNNGVNPGLKRKRGIELSTSTPDIWGRMQDSEVANIDIRQSTLEKWSAKVRGATSLPLSRKLNPTAAQQSITSLLQETLSNSEHLIIRTKIPRSCAPIQAKAKITEDENVYDDADFYQLLLKELVDQRMTDSTTSGGGEGQPMRWTAVKEAKTRKNVDTKASKGRKMRYTVHEKLQNFMAPEKRGSWEEETVDRFFGTLLGRKMDLGEDEMDVDEQEAGDREEEGLMLFRN